MTTSFLLIAVGVILLILKFLADFLAHVVTQDKENRVRSELENWRKSAMDYQSQPVFLPLFKISARLLARVFGPYVLSWKALRVTTIITSLLLVVCFALAVIFSKFEPPEQVFSDSIELLKKHSDENIKRLGNYSQFQRNASDLAEMRGPVYGVLFTAYYFLVTFGTTSLFSMLTLAFCRRLLETTIQVKDLFSLGVILIADIVGAVLLLIFQCTLLSILLNPAIWPSVPTVLHGFGQAPIVMLIITSVGSLLAPLFYWITSAPWLKIAVVLSLSPCFVIGGLIATNVITRLFKHTCSGYVVSFLDLALRSRRGIFQFFSFCFAVAIPLCSFVVWLAQMRLKPILIGSLFVISVGMTAKAISTRGAPGMAAFARSAFLFVGGLIVVAVGYYVQSIIECWRFPTAAPDTIADPFLSSLIPGAWAGTWFVHIKLSNGSFWRLATGLLAIITVIDLLSALFGYSPYADLITSVLYNLVGAPLGALAILGVDRFLFPQRIVNPAIQSIAES